LWILAPEFGEVYWQRVSSTVDNEVGIRREILNISDVAHDD
jgi:hypothetical protein